MRNKLAETLWSTQLALLLMGGMPKLKRQRLDKYPGQSEAYRKGAWPGDETSALILAEGRGLGRIPKPRRR